MANQSSPFHLTTRLFVVLFRCLKVNLWLTNNDILDYLYLSGQ
jgi:hypothetical protein